MANLVLRAIASFFSLSLSAMTLQNAVFARSLSIGRLVSIVDSGTDTVIFGSLLVSVNTLSGALFFIANRYLLVLLPGEYIPYLRPLGIVICMGISYFAVFIVVVKFARYERLDECVATLPIAAFNVAVMSAILIAVVSSFSFLNMIAFCLGSSAGFMLAVLLVSEGHKKLQNSPIPPAFKGLPAALLFLAGMAMAVYGINGHTFSL